MKVNYIENVDAMGGLKSIENNSIDCCITSPPYYNLRSYDVDGEFGCAETPEEYVNKLCDYYDEVFRILKKDGVVFVNLGDTYLGSGKGVWKGRDKANKESFQFKDKPKEKLGGWRKPKQLALIPYRFAIEMQNRGWILRNNINWVKPNAVPQSVNDRFTNDFESVFMFVKNKKYYFNKQYEKTIDGDKQRQVRTTWNIHTRRNDTVHTATFPEELVERMINSGCPKGGVVLDFFMGSGTTGLVAKKYGMNYIGFDLNSDYCKIADERIKKFLISEKKMLQCINN